MAAVDGFQLLWRELSRTCAPHVEALAAIGAVYAASRALAALRGVCGLARVHLLPRLFRGVRLSRRYGPWAVVHGASHPVASAYAEELARQGVNVIFVARDHAAAEDAAARLSRGYGVETAVVVVAAGAADPASVAKPVKEALRGRDVGFLVNCADEPPRRGLLETPERALVDSVDGHVALATLLARLVLPGMVERGRGAVVNVGSGACCRPVPGRAALSACTGYLDNFSRALHLEYGSKGIFVQSLIPFQVAPSRRQGSTSGWTLSGDSWLAPSADVYAQHAISTLGVANRTTGYWPHTLQYGLMTCIPEWIWVLGCRVLLRAS